MKDYKFKTWLEFANFGLDTSKRPKDPDPENTERPIMPLSVEYVVKSLKRKVLGEKFAIPGNFFGEVQWGEQDGAIRLVFSPFAGNNISIKKLTHDLAGDPQWICKKVIEVKNLYDSHPDKLTFKVQEVIEKIDREDIDAPIPDFKDMQKLVINIAGELKRWTTQRIFMYEGIRVIKDNYKYIIHFGLTGMGVQARDQRRLDQYAIHAEYDKKTGLIKTTGSPLGDKIRSHSWQYSPSTFIEYFSPAQHEDEIIGAILAHFNCY